MSARRRRIVTTWAAACFLLPSLASCAHFVVLHDPLNAPEHGDLGVAYESGAQLELAAKEYRRALRIAPHQSRTRVNLGNVQAAQGNWSAAEKSFRRALLDSVTNTDAMNNLAVALVRRGHHRDEARRLAEHAVALSGGSDSLYRSTLAEVNASVSSPRTSKR